MPLTTKARNLARDWIPSLLLAIVLFHALSWYQSRGMLGEGDQTRAPAFELPGIDGQLHKLDTLAGRPAILYFFAPWCKVCRASARNLRALKEAKGDELAVLFIALDYETVESVVAFAERHSLPTPVLLGAADTGREYRIKGYPTYYVLDRDGMIVSRDLGYTTKLGLWWRTWRLQEGKDGLMPQRKSGSDSCFVGAAKKPLSQPRNDNVRHREEAEGRRGDLFEIASSLRSSQ